MKIPSGLNSALRPDGTLGTAQVEAASRSRKVKTGKILANILYM
jgi:hypothetical protein